MRLRKSFDVSRSREQVTELLCSDETLLGLFPDSRTEITERDGDSRTTQTHYSALGQEGVATFRFSFLMDGNLRFEKVCDGRVWRELVGEVSVEERGEGSRVEIEMTGRTKSLVPEFAIKGPMKEQIEQMVASLRARLDEA